MSEHAYLPPSGADEWTACARWPYMQHRFPDLGEQSAADEGTLAHAVLAAAILGEPEPPGATDEMREGAAIVLEHLVTLPVTEWVVEKRITGRAIHDSQNWGTPDLIGWQGMTLYVGDYKFGYGYVDHVRNLQLLNYALLEIERAQREDGLAGLPEVVVTVYQPRCYRAAPVRTWTCPPSTLNVVLAELRAAAQDATRMDAPATTGPQCDHCNGRHACDALAKVADRALDLSMAIMPVDADVNAIGRELAVLREAQRRLDARISGYEEQVTDRLKRGGRVEGWALESGVGREKWLLPADAIITMYGPKFAKPSVITPAQARKAKLADADVLAGMTGREPTQAKLVPAARIEAKAAEVFTPAVKG